MRLPAVDAWNVTYQQQLREDLSFEVAYVGNKGTHVFAGGGPAYDYNQAAIDPNFGSVVPGQPVIPRNLRRNLFQLFGWTQGIDFFCNCADNRYNALQTKITKHYSKGWSLLAHYTWGQALFNDGEQFDFDRALNRGRQDFDRTHSFTLTQLYELPFGKDRRYLSDVPKGVDWVVGGWQFNSTTTIQSGLPFNVCYNNAGQDRDTGPCRPNLIGDPATGGDQNMFFNATPIGSPGSAFERPAAGTFGNLERNSLDGPGYWRTDASLLKKFHITETMNIEFRVEVVNLFNHVNLGQPDSNIGVPDNPATPAFDPSPNDNAGRITSTAYFGADPQRNFQWALKFTF
jgi:hypothetical protein